MSVAIGSRSTLSAREETLYGVTPVGDYEYIRFNSETLGENINTILSEEVRSDRSLGAVRGGNISTDGQIVQEWYPSTQGKLLRHLLTTTPVTQGVDPLPLTGAVYPLTVTMGEYYHQNGNIYLVTCNGTVTIDPNLTFLEGSEEVDDTVFEYGDVLETPVATVADNLTDDFTTIGHGLVDGDIIVLKGTTAPLGLTLGATYFIRSTGETAPLDEFSLFATRQDAIDDTNEVLFTDDGTAVSYVIPAFYQHDFLGDVDKPCGGLSIQKCIIGTGPAPCTDQPQYWLFHGCRVNSVDISIPQEGIITGTWGIIGLSVEQASTTFVTTNTINDPVFEDPNVGYDVKLLIDNVDEICVSDINLSINNNYDDSVFCIGSRYRHDLPEGRREVTGSFTVFFETIDTYEAFKEEHVQDLKLGFHREGVYMEMHMPETKFTGGTPTPLISGNGTIQQNFEIQAFKRDAAYDIRIRVKTPISSFLGA